MDDLIISLSGVRIASVVLFKGKVYRVYRRNVTIYGSPGRGSTLPEDVFGIIL